MRWMVLYQSLTREFLHLEFIRFVILFENVFSDENTNTGDDEKQAMDLVAPYLIPYFDIYLFYSPYLHTHNRHHRQLEVFGLMASTNVESDGTLCMRILKPS
jgi:hypothetical protein